MAAFQLVAEARFPVWLSEYIKQEYPNVTVKASESSFLVSGLPSETLIAMVRNGLEKAGRYGLEDESAEAAFVVLMFVTAPNFDTHPIIQSVLNDLSVRPNERIEQLFQRTSDEDWENIEQSYDPNAWQFGANTE